MTSELPLRHLDGAALRRWAFRSRSALGEYRGRLDGLNVFPVADNDTGTNLAVSLRAGLESIARSGVLGPRMGIADGAAALSRSLLLSARGNSGVILGLLVSGLAEVFAAETAEHRADSRHGRGGSRARAAHGRVPGIDAATLARAMVRASDKAWEGVDEPVEGTILSVARAAAGAARAQADAGGDLAATVTAADQAARRALATTPQELSSHAAAGVVDAGGAGLVIVLAALTEVVTGEPVQVELPAAAAAVADDADQADRGGAYEVMYAVEDCPSDIASVLRTRLAALGDSLVVAGDDELLTVHVHTDDPGAAIEVALQAGNVHSIRVEWLAGRAPGASSSDRVAQPGASDRDSPVRGRGPAPTTGVVACVDGPGLAATLRAAGVAVVQPTGAAASPQDVLAAARGTAARDVAVLTVADADRLVVDTAVRLAGPDAPLLHPWTAESVVHLLSAASLVETDLEATDLLDRFTEAAGRVRSGVVTATDAATGPLRGVVDKAEDVYRGGDAAEATLAVLDRLVEDGTHEPVEVVTVVAGAEADTSLDELVRRCRRAHPHLEVTGVVGGSPSYVTVVGVE